MNFTGRNSSDSISKMKKNRSDCREDELPTSKSASGAQNESIRLQTERLIPLRKSRLKLAAVLPKLAVEDVDIDKELCKERCFDDKECMWLSSDALSPSSFFEEYRLSAPLHRSVDKWVVSWLSNLADSYLSLDTGISNEDAYLHTKSTVSDPQKIIQGDLKEQRGSVLLTKSPGSDAMAYSSTRVQRAGTSFGECYEDTISFDNLSTPLSSNLDSSFSQVSDLDTTLSLDSSVILDGKDYKSISDTELKVNSAPSCPLSPSYKISSGSEVLSYNSGIYTYSEIEDELSKHHKSSEHSSDAADLEDINIDEPLFWPFEQITDWSSEESWKKFSMSPRKDMKRLGAPERSSTRSIREKIYARKVNSREGFRRRLIFNSAPTTSKIQRWESRINNNDFKRTNDMPSRLKKSSKNQMNILPFEIENGSGELTDGKAPFRKSVCENRNVLEDDFDSNGELLIEKVLGLHEFDGHEGIEREFDEQIFSLDESLEQS